MAAFLVISVIEVLFLVLLLVRLEKTKDVRFSRLSLMTACAAAQILFCVLSLFDTTSVPELRIVYLLLSFNVALIGIASAVIGYVLLKTVLEKLRLENGVTRTAFFLFRCFVVLDALVLLSNPMHGMAFHMQPLPVYEWTVMLFPRTGPFLSIHFYVLLLQSLTVTMALFYKGATLPLLYGSKYLLFGGVMACVYVVAMLTSYLTDLFFLRTASVLLLSSIPFFLYYFFYYNKPFFSLAYIRQMAIDKLGSPVVLFDLDDLLVDFNADAGSLFALEHTLVNHLTLGKFLQRAVGNQMRERSSSTVEEVTVTDGAGLQQIFKLDYTKLSDRRGKSLGTLLLFHNITELKTLYNTMEKTAMTDIVTGLASKSMLEKKITEINLYRKYPYCAVICNINGLNLISTGFGETAETAATMHVADVLRSHLRASDFASYADGNFVVLMNDTLEAEANLVSLSLFS